MVTSNKVNKLNQKQALFCKLYVSLGNASEAFRQAGYSENGANGSASRLLANASIKAEIAKHQQELEQSSTVDAAFVINGLRDIATNGNTESNRVRSYELLGKTLRMFVEVSESTVHHDAPQLQQFSEDQLRTMLAEAENKALPVHVEDAETQESPSG